MDIGLEVALEALEVAPAASPEELVLDVPEDLLGPWCPFGAVLIAHQHKRVCGERDGEYVGLDFGHLCDLAAIDHMLRYALLPMTPDVEHFAKAKLMRGPTERPEEDGYSIVGDYLAGLSKKSLDIRVGEMRRLENDRYSGGLARKCAGACPAWALAELVSFGSLIDFYRFCALRWGDKEMRREHCLLKQAKAVRNACARSTAIVNGFAPGIPSNVRTPNEIALALAGIGLNKRARHSMMSNARVQRITMAAFAYRELVRGDHSREMCRALGRVGCWMPACRERGPRRLAMPRPCGGCPDFRSGRILKQLRRQRLPLPSPRGVPALGNYSVCFRWLGGNAGNARLRKDVTAGETNYS